MRLPKLFVAPIMLMIGALPAAAENNAAKIFHGVGKVTSVDAADGLVMLDHQAIPGLMDAMEMQYEVKPAKLLDGLAKGDRVDFDVDGKLVIRAIHKAN